MPRHRTPPAVRFRRRIETVDGYGNGAACWEWPGHRQQNGYGQIGTWKGGPILSAHRLAWIAFRGPIPRGLLVLHRCDNPPCCNPAHLYLGTAKDNARDCVARGRRAKQLRPHTRVRKLSDDAVRAIRADDRPAHIVAYEHGVSEGAIYNIKARRRKALVPD